MKISGLLAWIGIAVGVGAAMAVALDDKAVGMALGVAIATAITRSSRSGNCAIGPRARG